MATPTTLPATAVAGDILTAAYVNNLKGAFRVLNVTTAVGTASQGSTSATFADITGLSITITPQSNTNKILIVSTNALFASANAADAGIRFLRGATNIFTSIPLYALANNGATCTSIFLDSPATTSATTYKVQFNQSAGTGTVISNLNYPNSLSTLLVMEISA